MVAVCFQKGFGPCFGDNSLSVLNNESMKAFENCHCYTNRAKSKFGSELDNFGIPTDPQGNSVLTGCGAGKLDNEKKFTLLNIETWQLE